MEENRQGNIFQQIGQIILSLNQPPPQNVYHQKVVHCFYEVISYTNDRSVTAAAMQFGVFWRLKFHGQSKESHGNCTRISNAEN